MSIWPEGMHSSYTTISSDPFLPLREEENLREENVEEVECDPEEDMEQLRAHEEDFIQGLINAAGYHQEEKQRIEISITVA